MKTIEVVAAIILKDGEVFATQRGYGDFKGWWEFPGGKIEERECPRAALVREIREETGLTVLDPHLCGVKQFPIDGGRYLVFLFKAKSFTGTLRASEEGSVEWIERSELPMLPTVADFSELLSVFDRDDLSEFQYVIHGTRWDAVLK